MKPKYGVVLFIFSWILSGSSCQIGPDSNNLSTCESRGIVTAVIETNSLTPNINSPLILTAKPSVTLCNAAYTVNWEFYHLNLPHTSELNQSATVATDSTLAINFIAHPKEWMVAKATLTFSDQQIATAIAYTHVSSMNVIQWVHPYLQGSVTNRSQESIFNINTTLSSNDGSTFAYSANEFGFAINAGATTPTLTYQALNTTPKTLTINFTNNSDSFTYFIDDTLHFGLSRSPDFNLKGFTQF